MSTVTGLCWSTLIGFALIAGCSSSHLGPALPNNTVQYACTGSSAILPWTVNLDSGEVIEEIKWLLAGQTWEMIALYIAGNFLPTPPFANRVRGVTNAGMALDNITSRDSGSYIVEVTVRSSTGAEFNLNSMATLKVIDSPVISGQLEVGQQRQAVYDAHTQAWALDLTCGRFVYSGHTPPFSVEWTDPEGHTVPSSFYDDKGLFHLLVPSPDISRGGSYTCRVPRGLVTCPPQHAQQTGFLEGRVSVDPVDAWVSVLEAQQAELRGRDGQLSKDVSALHLDHHTLSGILSGLEKEEHGLIHQHDALRQQAHHMQTEANSSAQALDDLLRRVQNLEAAWNTHTHTHTPSTSPQTSQTPDLQQLETKLKQLNESAARCCQEHAELLHNNSRIALHSAQLSKDLASLAQRVNSTTAGWSLDGGDLNRSLSEVEQGCSDLEVCFGSLGALVNEARQAGLALSQRVGELEKSGVGSAAMAGSSAAVDDVSHRLMNVERQISALNSSYAMADVSFHARMVQNPDHVSLTDGQPVVYGNAINNRGTAYDSATGTFSAPVQGTYFFFATFSAKDREHSAQVSLMKDSEEVGYGETYTIRHYETGSVHAVLELSPGQRVWLKNRGDDNVYYTHIGSFTGTLLRPRV